MKEKVFVFGATGFVGSLVLPVLKRYGFELAILLRDEKEKAFFEKQGIKTFSGDITNQQHIETALHSFQPTVVVHLVGIIEEKKPHITFQKIHVEGTEHIVTAAKAANVSKIIYVSALGSDMHAPTKYFQTKAQAESLVKDSGIHWTIFRPSIIFGKKAGFTNQLLKSFQYLPFMPIIGDGHYPFMPVAGEVVGECVSQAVTKEETNNKTYDLYGPELLTIAQITKRLKVAAKKQVPLIHIPLFLIKPLAFLSTCGFPVPITADQLTMLLMGSTTTNHDMEKDFTIPSIPFDPKGTYPLF